MYLLFDILLQNQNVMGKFILGNGMFDKLKYRKK